MSKETLVRVYQPWGFTHGLTPTLAVETDPEHPLFGWLFACNVDGNYVSLCDLKTLPIWKKGVAVIGHKTPDSPTAAAHSEDGTT